jgi:WD40 repeat protein
VRDVAYSPNGELFASVGSDGKLFLYEGKEGEVKAEMDVHKGSAVS